ncbi:hypothetical protein [Bradyrhizobium sp. ORS 285]|uniref:hypothetical protein n=1 Tax=Bradyrhizobium sp. ORS 285 TaxID=115808 RepID=UPI0002EF7C67|nr:hypothetical protein [Bradyrhizobium sp. ORS 285]
MAKLAARFLKVQGEHLVEVTRLLVDDGGHTVFRPAIALPFSFAVVELFDGSEDRRRLRMRGMNGLLYRGDGGGLEMQLDVPFPAVVFKDIPPSKTDIGPDFACMIGMRFAPALFGADGSLRIDHYHLEYRTWKPGGGAGDAPPHDEAHYQDAAGNPKPISLKQLTERAAERSVELNIFGTNADVDLTSGDYPLLADLFRNGGRIEFEDRSAIPPQDSPDFKFDKPRAVGVKPIGIRATAQDAASTSCSIAAVVDIGPKAAAVDQADLRFDDCLLATGTSVRDRISIELIQDGANDGLLGVGVSRDPNRYCWYVRARPVPATIFSTIWNERIAKPYLDALRITDDARDLSFVPLLENIGPVTPGGTLPAFDLAFDLVQQRQDRKASRLSSPVLIGFRPHDAERSEFAADAIFPGLINHDGNMVRRRLKVTIERQPLNESFEWFDIAQRKPGSQPTIVVTLETAEGLTSGLIGGKVRLGALDLDVPHAASGEQGQIRIRYNVTFDPADPTRGGMLGAEKDPKGVAGRARLPRRGEALPRVAARIDRFDLHGALPGSQDPIPDAGRAFDAVLDELARAPAQAIGSTDPRQRQIQREKQIAADLQREAAVVLIDDAPATPADTPFFLHGEEVTRTNRNRQLSLTLHRRATKTRTEAYRTIVIDREPMTVALIDVPAFELDSEDVAENDGEIANWQTSELAGSYWDIARISDGFDLFLPPQATGEAAEKGHPWPTISPRGSEQTIDFRLGTAARLRLRSSYFKQRYAEAPWNLRRILGYAGQRAPGAGLDSARFEFLYGLASRLTAPSLRLAELGSRIGGVRDPLPARPRGITRSLLDGTETQAGPSLQPLVEAELYDRFRDVSASFTKAWNTRVGVFEAYRDGHDEPLSVEDQSPDKVAFVLRVPGAEASPADLDPEPWNPDSGSTKLKGGATWGFESKNIHAEVIARPSSTRGQIINPSFSALGGSGFVRAFFANGKTRIVSDTSFGRTHSYAVERIGRIARHWNVAKHVIVYERTVLPPDQFAAQQAGQHLGRPVLRKVREYVDILEPERRFPEAGANLKKRALYEACVFRTLRIPVDSRWGHDVPDGWVVPLWHEGEDPDIYPKPDIRLHCTGAHTDAAAAIAARSAKPQQFVFFTSTRPEDGDNPNLWPAREGVDFDNRPPPAPAGTPGLDSGDPDAPAADDIMHDPLHEGGTFDIDSDGAAANLVATRSSGEPIAAVLQTITVSRGQPTGVSGGAAGQALALRQELERILAEARGLDAMLDGVLSQSRGVLGNLLRVVNKTRPEIEAALNVEIDRLGAIKPVIHREAAKVRDAINAAVARAKANLAAARSGWTDAADVVEARLKRDIENALLSRLDGLEKELEAVVARVDEFLASDAPAQTAEVLARRIEETLAPVRLTIFSALNVVGEALARLDRSIATFRVEIAAARDLVEQEGAVLNSRIGALATPSDFHSLVTLYESYHAKALTSLDAVDKVARRGLPREIKDRKLFAAGAKTLLTVLADLRTSIVQLHDVALGEVARSSASIETAKAVINRAVGDTVAQLSGTASAMQALTDAAAGLTADAESALANFRSGLQADYDGTMDRIHEICRKTASGVGAIKDDVRKALRDFATRAGNLKTRVHQAADQVLKAIAGLLDEVGVAIGVQEQKLDAALDEAATAARTTIGTLEATLVAAVDDVIARLKGQAGNLAGAIANASDRIKQGAADLAQGLRDKVPPDLADDVRVLEEGYKRLSNAPSFQNPSETLALIRAAGSAPILPNLKFNRERIAYFFDDAREAVQSSPVVGLMNRMGDDLKALGIRVPTNEFLDRLIPKGMENYDFGKLFPDLGGLKLDGLFKNVRLPSLNDNVKVTHGFDKASLTAWAKAEARAPFPSRSEVFEIGPLKLSVVGARFDALADLAVGLDGITRRTTKGEVVGDWELAFSGTPLVTLEQTRVFFENGQGLNVDIDPTRVRLDKAIKFLSDLIKSFSEPNSGFFIEMLEDGGAPSGLAARIELPLPPLSFGAFSVTGLRFSASFELLMIKGSGGRRGDFALGTTLALGRKSEPFVLRVWILVGGGWLETSARYFPSSGRLLSHVSVGLTAGLGLDFAFGPCRGFVYVMVGAYVEFDSGGGSSFSIAVIFLVRGGIVILGRFNIGLYLLLELIYQNDGSVIGRGTIEVSFKICWCCEIKVRQGVTYYLKKGSGATQSGQHLDHFA